MIRAHPVTGRKVLFVNEGFTVYVEGMPKTESDLLLQELFAHIVRPEVLYTHKWRQRDLLMWDNCLVQHRAVRDYELPLRRLMHRTTVAGAARRLEAHRIRFAITMAGAVLCPDTFRS